MKNNKNYRRLAALGLTAVLTLSLAGCGKDGKSQQAESVQTGINGYVYVPEYVSLDDGGAEEENRYLSNQTFSGNYMYYTENKYDMEAETNSITLMRRELKPDAQAEVLPVQFTGDKNINKMLIDAEGNIYLFLVVYTNTPVSETGADASAIEMEYTAPASFIQKYDAQGTQIFEQDITEIMNDEGDNNNYIQYAVLDGQGRIYVSANNIIRLFNADGSYQGKINIGENSWISSLGTGRNGKAYYSNYSSTGNGMQLTEINFEGKSSGEVYQNFPSSNTGISKGIEKELLTGDNSSLYEYDIASQSSEKLLDWLDSDINGSYVEHVSAMDDGRLAVMTRDWDTGEEELIYLTKTEASKVEEKKILTVATMSGGQELQAQAVKFNKSSDKYRIKIKTYVDYNQEWTEHTYDDALKLMNNDIVSGTNTPDLIDLSDLNVKQLVSKGVLEDLGSYLDGSEVVKREDLLDVILNGFTVDGRLIAIPKQFYVQTVFGRASEVGGDMGWTLDEVLAYADKYPDAEIFEWSTSESIINFLLSNNQDAFIDWEKGTCSFNSDEFRKLLEFAGRFPTELDDSVYSSDRKSTPAKIQDRDVLLYMTALSDANELQVCEAMYGEPVTAVGYPTVDGSAGTMLRAQSVYGIASKSANKEGAWQFIEQMLKPEKESERTSHFGWGFPSNKEALEKMLEKSMEADYALDENGEPMLDENGEKIVVSHSSYSFDDFTIEIMPATQEQVDSIKEIISVAKLSASSDQQILNIITEEAAPYFKDQKTIDEVVDVIQSRIQIYVSENS